MSAPLKRMLHRLLPATALVCLIIVIAVSLAAASPTARDYWPTQNWRTMYPETQGMDSDRLLKVIRFIIKNLPDIRSLLVVRHGYIVFENYYATGAPDRQDTIHSVTKSITSILVGIARDQGLLGSLDKKLYDYLPEYFDASVENGKKAITLEHLLTMTAGLQPIKAKDRQLMLKWIFSPDATRFTFDLPQVHPPGKHFAYSNPVSHLLGIVLTRTTGEHLWDFATRTLFDPLGIKPKLWKADAQGYNFGSGGLYMCARDMAKIGFLYLNQGLWDGKQIVSAAWVAQSTRRQVAAGSDYGYGYQWWTKDVAGCPAFLAWGLNGQFIVVVPALDLVTVITSQTGMPGKPSDHYAPLFDIVAEAVVDKHCQILLPPEKVISGNKNLPPDLQKFFNGFARAVESKNIDSILAYYADDFLQSGRNKTATVKLLTLFSAAVDTVHVRVDQCRLNGDRAYISGELETNHGPYALSIKDLIKRNGIWLWYGDQQEQ